MRGRRRRNDDAPRVPGGAAVSRIGVAFISDRGDKHLPDCLASFDKFVDLRHTMRDSVPPSTVIDDRDHRLGLAGAVQAAWDWAVKEDLDYLLHVEEDFRFVEPVDVESMVDVLVHDESIAQVVLKRQPWSPEERRAGGIIEMHPHDYTPHTVMVSEGEYRRYSIWTEHRRIFSLNPCLIPRHILERGWPAGNEAEMTTNLLADGYKFAFYGAKDDPPRVIHVGHERSAGWRL